MKRYLLFWFQQFYPCGGWNDLLDSFDAVGDATELAFKRHKPGDLWFGDFQLVDGQTGEVIENSKWMRPYESKKT